MKKTSKILLIFIILAAFLIPSYSVRADDDHSGGGGHFYTTEELAEKLAELSKQYANDIKNNKITYDEAFEELKKTSEYNALVEMLDNNSDMADGILSLALTTAVSAAGRGPVTYNENVKDCDGIFGDPNNEDSTIYMIQKILNYVKVLAPLLVVLLSGIDFSKTVLSGDPQDMKKVTKKLVIRLACAAGVFLAPFLTGFIINFINNTTRDTTCGLK